MVGEKANSTWRVCSASSKIGSLYCLTDKELQTGSRDGNTDSSGMEKPPEDFLMVNVDASYDENRDSGSTGVIIRDCSGDMIVAASRYIPHLVDAPMAEAFALKDGLMLSQQIGGNRIIIQSDCMEVTEIMSNGGCTANSAAAIYDECNTVWRGFQKISIEHVSRDANQVAHALARQAMILNENCMWDNEPPNFNLPM